MNLIIDDSWADAKWKRWVGQIENKYEYEILDRRKLTTNMRILECFVIKSKKTSRIGETELIAFFNPKDGFVKLAYSNIDKSKTSLELIEH